MVLRPRSVRSAYGVAAAFREVGLVLFLVHGEVQVLLHLLEHAAVLVAADERLVAFQLLEDVGVLEDAGEHLVAGHAELDLQELADRAVEFLVGRLALVAAVDHVLRLLEQAVAQRLLLAVQRGHERLELVELVRGDVHRAGDDQRRARLVDEDGVDFVDDHVVIIALDKLFLAGRHAHVAEVVEPEFAVRAVGDVTGVLRLALRGVHGVLDAADRKAEELEHAADPLGVAEREVVVHGDELAVVAGKRVQVQRHGGDERLAFAGGHFRDLALMEHDAADDLHVERDHVPHEVVAADLVGAPDHAAAGVLHDGERLAHHGVERFALGVAVLELLRFGFQLLVGERLVRFLQGVDLRHQGTQAFHVAFRFAAEYLLNDRSKHG